MTRVRSRGFEVLGGIDWLPGKSQETQFVIGIGTGSVRSAIDSKLTSAGFGSATLIHPAATLGNGARVGDGTVICAGVRATTNISLDRHVPLNINTTVGHDCTLADYVTVNPLVAVSGGVNIGSESMLGTHSAVLQQLRVGARSVVGAGSCVVRDVPDDAAVKGVPAK
jgi:sugar O-acyltransferase (sialic acid O-acetyltransferase NeuD family)